MKYEIDPEYLFSPVNGAGKSERAIVENYFRVNYTHRFNVGRITRAGKELYGVLAHYKLYTNSRPFNRYAIQKAQERSGPKPRIVRVLVVTQFARVN